MDEGATGSPPWRDRSTDPAPRAPALQSRGTLFAALDPVDEAPRHRSQRELRVDVESARDVDRCEEDVAHLFEDVRRRLGLGGDLPSLGERLLQLTHLVVEIRESAGRVGIFEADRGGASLYLTCVQERRE